ncbi:hypothetical protein LCGC14_2143430 [marine sediment metagenome]|uniref:Uncharacterized protein n=1 Tax=marine sediment metagenome TaxID=412755 RepID=A0A0F9DXP0_9ZZZZ
MGLEADLLVVVGGRQHDVGEHGGHAHAYVNSHDQVELRPQVLEQPVRSPPSPPQDVAAHLEQDARLRHGGNIGEPPPPALLDRLLEVLIEAALHRGVRPLGAIPRIAKAEVVVPVERRRDRVRARQREPVLLVTERPDRLDLDRGELQRAGRILIQPVLGQYLALGLHDGLRAHHARPRLERGQTEAVEHARRPVLGAGACAAGRAVRAVRAVAHVGPVAQLGGDVGAGGVFEDVDPSTIAGAGIDEDAAIDAKVALPPGPDLDLGAVFAQPPRAMGTEGCPVYLQPHTPVVGIAGAVADGPVSRDIPSEPVCVVAGPNERGGPPRGNVDARLVRRCCSSGRRQGRQERH